MATATSLCGLGTNAREIMTYGIVPDGVDAVSANSFRNDEPDPDGARGRQRLHRDDHLPPHRCP